MAPDTRTPAERRSDETCAWIALFCFLAIVAMEVCSRWPS